MVGELGIQGATSATMVAQAAAGDAFAFARIVAAHHDDMARVCYVICGDRELAQDAVQAAWPIAWRKLGALRDPERLRPWLMAVAANEARQILRRQRRYQVKDELARVDSSLQGALAELRDLGLVLLDTDQGRVGFPTVVNNRRAYFSWHAGEEGLHSWHFADEDVSRPIPLTWLKEISFSGKA